MTTNGGSNKAVKPGGGVGRRVIDGGRNRKKE